MLSLSNAFSIENVKDFIKKIKNFLHLKESEKIFFSLEPKIDGISASLKYVNGTFISLWHNDTFSNYKQWEGWKNVYTEMVKFARL